MSTHPFDTALALQAGPDGSVLGHTSADYWNMVGPFGGITAAQALNAVLQHPQRLGEPISMTVNFAGAMAAGAYTASAVPVRTNRSTQHWMVTLSQTDAQGETQVCTTATVVTALRRPTWHASDAPMPEVPAPQDVPQLQPPGGTVEWLQRYEMRPIVGGLPQQWDGTGEHSLSRLWVRDAPARVPCFASLAALADVFFPRVWLRRATRVPAGTVSMTVYFHADASQLLASGTRHLLAQAQAMAFRHGFFDQSGLLWNADGLLLASTHQIVYFKE
jgi:acyl-CoA thioesterase